MALIKDRWVLADWQSCLELCRFRNASGIRCIIDVLGEDAKDELQAAQITKAYIYCAHSISEGHLDASLTVKLTALGVLFDGNLARDNALNVLRAAAKSHVGFEIDMEGKPLVGLTLETALACAEVVRPMTLAMQAYLDRTPSDLERIFGKGICVRLVKGAYLGDLRKFEEIQGRFRMLFNTLLNAGRPFCVGTHDPELLEWARERASQDKDLVEFGFLKGLADETKVEMAKQGWKVAEYVPFGASRTAYEARRRKYLRELERLGRQPAD